MDRLLDRRLSRSNAVSRRDRRLRTAFRDSQKCAHLTLESVVLSGFPTTAEPSFPHSLPPGADARTLSLVRKKNQKTFPQEDIPPPLAFTLEVCRLRLARIWIPLTLRSHSRVQYGQAGKNSFLVGSRSRSCG
jgi:hypothetical protein